MQNAAFGAAFWLNGSFPNRFWGGWARTPGPGPRPATTGATWTSGTARTRRTLALAKFIQHSFFELNFRYVKHEDLFCRQYVHEFGVVRTADSLFIV